MINLLQNNFKKYRFIILLIIPLLLLISLFLCKVFSINNSVKFVHITYLEENLDLSYQIALDKGINTSLKDNMIYYNYSVFYYNKLFFNNSSKNYRFKILKKSLDNINPKIIIVSGKKINSEIIEFAQSSNYKFIFIDMDKKINLPNNATGIISSIPSNKLKKITDHIRIKSSEIAVLSDYNSNNTNYFNEINESFENNLKYYKVKTLKEWSEILNNTKNIKLFIILNIYQIKNDIGKYILPQDIVKYTTQKTTVPCIGIDKLWTTHGGLASIHRCNYCKGYMTGNKIAQIIFGTPISEIPVEGQKMTFFLINQNKSKNLGLNFDNDYLENELKVDVKYR